MERLTEIEYKGKAYRVRLRKIMPEEFVRLIEKDTIVYNDDHKEFRMNGEAVGYIQPSEDGTEMPFLRRITQRYCSMRKISADELIKIWRKT